MAIECRDILAAVPGAECIESLDYFEKIGSTSSWLATVAAPAPGCCRIAIGEEQTAGRGRRDRRWTSPKGAGLWLSLSWTFEKLPPQPAGLTLAIGVALANALDEIGAGIRLKWPNDLMANDAKLGGILTEMQAQAERQRTVIVGMGINVDLPDAAIREIEAEHGVKITDLAACLDPLPEHTTLAALVIAAAIGGIRRFAAEGLAADLEAWQRYDWLAGKRIKVRQEGRSDASGVAWGIDADGALLLRTHGSIRRIVAGSIELQESAASA